MMSKLLILMPQYACNFKIYFFYREQERFVLLCLRLLSTHLSLALAGGVAGTVLGSQARPLRNLLFRLMDMNTPLSVQEVSKLY